MRLLHMEVDNFKALKGKKYFDFPDGIIGITGPNGRGKSTIPNAIAWSLFGADALKTTKSDVVTWGENKSLVSLSFETAEGIEWSVERRQHSNGIANASLYNLSDGSLAASGLDATNREVQRILSLDRVGFFTSVYARQDELAGLMSLTPANRVKTVLRLLRFEQLTTAIENVKSSARDYNSVLKGIRLNLIDRDKLAHEIAAIDDELLSCRTEIADQQERLQLIEKERQSLVEKQIVLVPDAKKYEIYQEKRNKASVAVAMAESEVGYAERQTKRPQPPKPAKPIPAAVDPNEVERRSNVLFSARQSITNLQTEIRSLQRDTGVCPACHRPFDNRQERESHIGELQVQLDQLREKVQLFERQYEEAKQSFLLRTEWDEAFSVYTQYAFDQEKAQVALQEARDRLDRSRQWQESIEVVPDPTPALRAVKDGLLECQVEAGQIREAIATLAERVRGLEQARVKASEALEAAKAQARRVRDMERAAITTETAASELARLKSSMIAQIIPALSQCASRLISEFTDGRYNEISLTNDYEIQYRNDVGEFKGFEHLSGGEKDVFALALRLAISDLRAGDIGLLMLDEVMESLDTDRQEATWNAIERLTNRYNQVLLVTHVQTFKDRAETVIAL